MYKTALKCGAVLCCGLIGLLIFLTARPAESLANSIQVQASPQARNPTLDISVPGMQEPLGHPGTSLSLTGNDFTPNSQVSLYTTPDPNECKNGGQLTTFSSKPLITVNGNGEFTFTTRWPDNAANSTTGYYVCGLSSTTDGEKAVTSKPFTVSQAVTAEVSQDSIEPGDEVTVTGANWIPQQQVKVSLVSSSDPNQVIATEMDTSDREGNFSVKLTVNKDAEAGSYTLVVVFANDPDGPQLQKQEALTIKSQATPTPSPTPEATPSPTPEVTPSVEPSPSPTAPDPGDISGDTGGGTSPITVLIFTLGGLGILLIIVGMIMFASSGPSPSRRVG